METKLSSPLRTPSPSNLPGNFRKSKFLIAAGVVIVVAIVALLAWRGVLKKPSTPGVNQPLTDEQKIQILKNLSGNSTVLQPTDQQKLQTLSQPQTNTSQPSDGDKLKTLQQASGK